MRHRRSIILGTLLSIMLPLTFSCAEPSSWEQYARSSKLDARGRFSFDVAADSSETRDVDIIMFMGVSRRRFIPFADSISVTWKSPSGKISGRSIPIDSRNPVQEEFFRRIYRYGIVESFDEEGMWNLRIGVPEGFIRKYSLLGIGIETRKNGTR